MSKSDDLVSDVTVDQDSTFKYDRSRYVSRNQNSNFPFLGTISLLMYDVNNQKYVDYGKNLLCIRPFISKYQIIVYQDQSKPFISMEVDSGSFINWNICDDIHVFLTDISGTVWTIQFEDKHSQIYASLVLASIVEGKFGSEFGTYDFIKGNGETVGKGDVVTVSYHGFVTNNLPLVGAMFDSKDDFTFQLGTTIKGLSASVLGMSAGGVRAAFIPPSLGYGRRSVGSIPLNSILGFIIKLIRIDKKCSPSIAQAPNITPEVVAPVQVMPQTRTGVVDTGTVQNSNNSDIYDNNNDIIARIQHSGGVKAIHGNNKPHFTPEKAQNSVNEVDIQSPYSSTAVKDSQNLPLSVDGSSILSRIEKMNSEISSKIDDLIRKVSTDMEPQEICNEVNDVINDIKAKRKHLTHQDKIIQELKEINEQKKKKTQKDQDVMNELESVKRENENLKREIEDLKTENATLVSSSYTQVFSKEKYKAFFSSILDEIRSGISNMEQKDIPDYLYQIFHKKIEEQLH